MEKLENKEKPAITLVRATPADREAYIKLQNNFLDLKTYSTITDPEEVVKEIEKCVVYFIKVADELIGTVSYEQKDSGYVYIDDLTIIPKFQGKGLGTDAMKKVLEEIGDVDRVDLVTHPDNSTAIKLYESLGFKIEETKENYFGDGEPRVVMSKTYAS